MRPEDKIVHAIMASAVCTHFLEEARHLPLFEKSLKNKVNLALKELLKASQYFEQLEEAKEDSAIDVHDTFWDFIKEISKVEIYNMDNMRLIIEAYRKDPKRLESIVKKILA